MPKLDPCPFCGAEICARLFDDVTGTGDEDTEGTYVLVHGVTESLCPIEHYDGEYLGMLTYNSPEEAAAIWNTRCNMDRT